MLKLWHRILYKSYEITYKPERVPWWPYSSRKKAITRLEESGQHSRTLMLRGPIRQKRWLYEWCFYHFWMLYWRINLFFHPLSDEEACLIVGKYILEHLQTKGTKPCSLSKPLFRPPRGAP